MADFGHRMLLARRMLSRSGLRKNPVKAVAGYSRNTSSLICVLPSFHLLGSVGDCWGIYINFGNDSDVSTAHHYIVLYCTASQVVGCNLILGGTLNLGGLDPCHAQGRC